jgi:hypothetical protein
LQAGVKGPFSSVQQARWPGAPLRVGDDRRFREVTRLPRNLIGELQPLRLGCAPCLDRDPSDPPCGGETAEGHPSMQRLHLGYAVPFTPRGITLVKVSNPH